MIKQLDEKTRVKLKIYLPALGYAFCLQRRRKFGWVTVSWIYPRIFRDQKFEDVLNWLKWSEAQVKGDLAIGRKIIDES